MEVMISSFETILAL